MPESNRLHLSYVVTNRELTFFSESEIRQFVLASFCNSLASYLMDRLVLCEKTVKLTEDVDYTLSPYRYSMQFGTEFSADLVVFSPEELQARDELQAKELAFNLTCFGIMNNYDGFEC